MPIRMNPAHDTKNPAGTTTFTRLSNYIDHVQKQEEIDNTLAKAIKRPSGGFKHPWEGVDSLEAFKAGYRAAILKEHPEIAKEVIKKLLDNWPDF